MLDLQMPRSRNIDQQEIMLDPTGTEHDLRHRGRDRFPNRHAAIVRCKVRLKYKPADRRCESSRRLDRDCDTKCGRTATLQGIARSYQDATHDNPPATNRWRSDPSRSRMQDERSESVIDPKSRQSAQARGQRQSTPAASPLASLRPEGRRRHAAGPADRVEHRAIPQGPENFATRWTSATPGHRRPRSDRRVPVRFEAWPLRVFRRGDDADVPEPGASGAWSIGFKCDEFNNLTNSYIVRQSHAHAWVEVLNDKREWITFDPQAAAIRCGKQERRVAREAQASVRLSRIHLGEFGGGV